MILKRKVITVTALLLVVCVTALIGNVSENSYFVSVKPDERPQIILDAGHGGLTNTIMAIFFETVQPHCFGAKS